jgi:hypothetical protein
MDKATEYRRKAEYCRHMGFHRAGRAVSNFVQMASVNEHIL